jgi:hypothetical protein
MTCYFVIELFEKYNNGNFKNQNKEFEFEKDDIIKNELNQNQNYDKNLFDIRKS